MNEAIRNAALFLWAFCAVNSEAYAAGELKHGTISLIEDNILVIGVLTQSELYEKTISNMVECKSRGAYLMGGGQRTAAGSFSCGSRFCK